MITVRDKIMVFLGVTILTFIIGYILFSDTKEALLLVLGLYKLILFSVIFTVILMPIILGIALIVNTIDKIKSKRHIKKILKRESKTR